MKLALPAPGENILFFLTSISLALATRSLKTPTVRRARLLILGSKLSVVLRLRGPGWVYDLLIQMPVQNSQLFLMLTSTGSLQKSGSQWTLSPLKTGKDPDTCHDIHTGPDQESLGTRAGNFSQETPAVLVNRIFSTCTPSLTACKNGGSCADR